MGSRGGHNKRSFGKQERNLYCQDLNGGAPLHDGGVDGEDAAFFQLKGAKCLVLGCCYVYKSWHAVANSKRKPQATWARCPEHGPFGRRPARDGRLVRVGAASALAVRAHGLLVRMVSPSPVVWEARVLAGHSVNVGSERLGNKSFDLWLPRFNLLVEVDGAQHTDAPYLQKQAEERMGRDLRYSRAAMAAGYLVVRLHECDMAQWEETVALALVEARKGSQVSKWLHLTSHYLAFPPWHDLLLTSHGPSGSSGGPACV